MDGTKWGGLTTLNDPFEIIPICQVVQLSFGFNWRVERGKFCTL